MVKVSVTRQTADKTVARINIHKNEYLFLACEYKFETIYIVCIYNYIHTIAYHKPQVPYKLLKKINNQETCIDIQDIPITTGFWRVG
jgi:hypothetical protein